MAAPHFHKICLAALIILLCMPRLSLAQPHIELEALANDPEYRALLEQLVGTVERVETTLAEASPAQRRRIEAEWQRMVEAFHQMEDNASPAFPPLLTRLSGLTAEDARALGETAHRLAERYPSLTTPAAYGQAAQQMPKPVKLNFNFPGDVDECDDCTCEQLCYQEIYGPGRLFDGLPLLAIPTAATIIGGFIYMYGPFIAEELIDQNVGTNLHKGNAYDDCVEQCLADDGGCNDDDDCPRSQYCSKSWFANKYQGECVPDKPLGKTCSRGEKCKSGCCRFHAWSHPASPVCRPADKCK